MGTNLDPCHGDLGYTRRRFFIDRFLCRLPAMVPQGGILLDLGGNKIRKRGQFDYDDSLFQVVYADLSVEKAPDIQTDAGMLPFRDESFDIVVCAEVLEHVYKPEYPVREIYRVLRPGGILVATVPFLVPIHAHPHDFGRYTNTFWNRLLNESGFAEINIETHGGFWIVIVDMFTVNFLRKAEKGYFSHCSYHLLSRMLTFFRNWALKVDSKVDAECTTAFTTGFGISCSKPDRHLAS